ncbi:hypothetical protein EG329_010665 [Mollisiaceae sp. DMI_Dod_QoI]|nr:hypothetical protein EG329_010665 [Helotiales sp. DMI_Dod_QoI]
MADPLNITVEQAREIVLSISHRKGWVRPELRESQNPESQELLEILRSIREELGDIVETIARDIYSRKSRFILELIQNAEDCEYNYTRNPPSMSFEVTPEKIIVEYNEDGFVENDVRQICHTGKSWKKEKPGYVGEKGIGFKSVFQIASRVQIQSNAFSFSFDYSGGPSSEEKLGIITPIPGDDFVPENERPLTRMILTLNNNISYEELVSHFTTIPESLLLFLSKLKELKVTIHFPDQGRTTTTTFHKEVQAAGVTRISKLVEGSDGGGEWRYHVTKTPVSDLPDEEARPGINECEIVLAFQVDEDDCPRMHNQYDIYTFLPVCRVGFNFLIQADFLLQASREEVIVDSLWNNAIINHIAKAFCNAMLNFCGRNSLRFRWMRYLPVGRAFEFNPLWRKLSSDVIGMLKQERILQPHDPNYPYSRDLRMPDDLRTLPSPQYLDRNGSPLFADQPGRRRKYLSLSYEPEDVEILKAAFQIGDIEDIHMLHRINQDLESPTSVMKAAATDDDWHSRAADLISTILQRSSSVSNSIKDLLGLIPLRDGRWVTARASTGNLFFPPQSGPEIPPDLIVTILPEAARNPSRRHMFTLLGARDCLPATVLPILWASYSQHDSASDLVASKAHLRYLYWHCSDHSDARFSRLWLYDTTLRKVNPLQRVIYLPSDDEYGPQELLKAVQDRRNPAQVAPECAVPYVNAEYMHLFPPSTRRHDISWLKWLERVIGVRRIPRLKYDAGSLSPEIRHILRYRPEKIIGTLGMYWATYRREMNNRIEEEISRAEVTCLNAPPTVLSHTYFPSPILTQRVHEFGITQGFPFLAVPGLSDDDRTFEEWRFLERFEVKFEANIMFYLEISRHHTAQQHQSWNETSRDGILRTYEVIADHCNEMNKAMVSEMFHLKNLILHPSAFQSNSTIASWLSAEDCFWRGPENLLDKTPLASVISYRNNRKLVRFFTEVLGIRNTNWHDYIHAILAFRRSQISLPDLSHKILQLYQLISLSESRMSEEDWESIRNTFQNESLIYDPSGPAWFAPSDCLWTSPVPIEGKAIIGSSYPDDLRPFFVGRLRISPASLSTLVEGLCSLAHGQPTVVNVKQMIWAINAMDPKKSDVDPLLRCSILPIETAGSRSPSISFQTCQGNFVINDRMKLADTFVGRVGFLSFSLEEVRQLDPFLQALDLSKKYLSSVCIEETACTDDGVVDVNLTEQVRDRAYYLLRCAVSFRSPLALSDPLSLYNQLSATSVLKAYGISTQYTIRLENGETIGPVAQNAGFVHIQVHDTTWQIFVPQDRDARDVCYTRELPDALTKLFKISPSARESIGHVLNSRVSIIEELLEQAGIATVQGIEPPRRRLAEDRDEHEAMIREATMRPQDQSSLLTPVGRQSQHGMPSQSTSGRELITRDSERSNASSSGAARASASPFSLAMRAPSPEYPEEDEYLIGNAYLELLHNVIRIASQIALPHYNAIPGLGNGDFNQGYDRVAAFGVRSQGQMNHDTKIGAAGELFVYEYLSNLRLPLFDWDNWRSTIRKEVRIHPRYANMLPWPHRYETADIVYNDVHSILTRYLIDAGYLDEEAWAGATPEYFIEVKTTTGACHDRFFLSSNQYRMMQEMTLPAGRATGKIYIICRVYNLGRENLNVRIYVDPEAHRGRTLAFETHTWTVRPTQ